jgi:hypothetical protein
VVELWEALLTLAMLPWLILLAWASDNNWY